MSYTKSLLENQEAQRQEAIGIAVEGGAIRLCEFHSDVTINNWVDPADAYRIANARFTAGELRAEYADRRELTDAIKAAIEESGEECYACENAFAD